LWTPPAQVLSDIEGQWSLSKPGASFKALFGTSSVKRLFTVSSCSAGQGTANKVSPMPSMPPYDSTA
jgi:hypothetical protein